METRCLNTRSRIPAMLLRGVHGKEGEHRCAITHQLSNTHNRLPSAFHTLPRAQPETVVTGCPHKSWEGLRCGGATGMLEKTYLEGYRAMCIQYSPWYQ